MRAGVGEYGEPAIDEHDVGFFSGREELAPHGGFGIHHLAYGGGDGVHFVIMGETQIDDRHRDSLVLYERRVVLWFIGEAGFILS